MLTYDEAKRLIDIFTDVKNVTTDVRLSYVMPYESGIDLTPDLPYINQIDISYFGCVDSEMHCLAYFVIFASDGVDDRLNFSMAAYIEKDDGDTPSEFIIKRTEILSDLLKKITDLGAMPLSRI